MSTTYTAVILLSLLSCLTTCVGVALAIALRENARAIAAGIGFSVGIMVLISIFELIPESITIMGIGASVTSAVLGAALVWAAHLIVPHTHFVEEKGVVAAKSVYYANAGFIAFRSDSLAVPSRR